MDNAYKYEWDVTVDGNIQTVYADRAIVTESGALLFLEENGPRAGMVVLVGYSPHVWTSFGLVN